MLPDGIRNASTRNVRRKNQTTSATTIDLVHSQTQIAAERDRSTGPPPPEGREVVVDVPELVVCAVMRGVPKEEKSSITAYTRHAASPSAASTWSGCFAASATRAQCRRTVPSGPIHTVERMTPTTFRPYMVFSPYAP